MAKAAKEPTNAFSYLRTSSASNVGVDKDSDKRQREAIESYARHAGYEIVAEFYDDAVKGSDAIDARPGFKALIDRIGGNGVRVVIVEDASRFARTLMVQEAGIAILVSMGVRVLTSRGDDLTDSDDEMRVAMRQIAGVFSQLEKTRLVKKLKGARERKREHGKCEGRKGFAELAAKDENILKAVVMAQRLRRASPKTGERRSLRDIATELASAGYLSKSGKVYTARSVQKMINADVKEAKEAAAKRAKAMAEAKPGAAAMMEA